MRGLNLTSNLKSELGVQSDSGRRGEDIAIPILKIHFLNNMSH